MDLLLSDIKQINQLQLAEIAPELCHITPGIIPVPGVEGNEKLQSISLCVDVLASKNRPKKIQLISNTGREYYYLLKGGEDLNLDHRMQQFISFSNEFVSVALNMPYFCRSYYMLPLGMNLGLIEWIDNCPSLFQICLQSKHKSHNPHHLYERKISELGYNLSRINRLDIPKDIAILALQELEQESGIKSDVIYSEFFSLEASTYSKQKQFCLTVAHLSMAGYILGLGDRHLQNILMDRTSCGIIHVDFGVCFEKGKKLKVPEVVPFRLTKAIEDGMSLYSSEKAFASICKLALGVIREHGNIFLDIFQISFRLHPISDWIDNQSVTYENISEEMKLHFHILKIQICKQ